MRINGKLYAHKYETLTTKDIFDQCNAVRNGFKSKPNSAGGLPFAYKGLITCADCGCLITFETKKHKYTYGHCLQYKRKHGAKYLRENIFTQAYASLLKSIVVPDDVITTILDLINQDTHKDNAESKSRSLAIKGEITRYEARIDRLYEDHLDDKIPDTLYERKASEYQAALTNLNGQLSTFELSDSKRYETVSHLLNVSKTAHKIFSDADYLGKRKILKKVLSNSMLDDDRLLLKLKEPYELMALCNENSTWQGLVEELRTFHFER